MADRAGLAGLRVGLVLATSSGGTGRHVHSLASGLTSRGVEVTLLAPASAAAMFGLDAPGVAYEEWDVADRPRPSSDLAAVRRLRQALRRVDVVHAHGLRAGGLSGLALAVHRRPPLVVTLHNAVLSTGVGKTVSTVLEKIVAKKAAAVLAVSPDLLTRATKLGAREVSLAIAVAPAPPRVHPDVTALRADLGATDRPLIVAAGRLAEQKGFDTLLEAANAWACRSNPPLVVIAGEGPLRDELTATIRAGDLPVLLLGHRDDVPALLLAADVLVVSSRWEGQPMLVQEMLRAGRPIVTTAVGGIPAMVGDAAVLVPPAQPWLLAQAVDLVLDSPELASSLSERALERAAALPSETDVLEQVTAIYTRVMSGRRSSSP